MDMIWADDWRKIQSGQRKLQRGKKTLHEPPAGTFPVPKKVWQRAVDLHQYVRPHAVWKNERCMHPGVYEGKGG